MMGLGRTELLSNKERQWGEISRLSPQSLGSRLLSSSHTHLSSIYSFYALPSLEPECHSCLFSVDSKLVLSVGTAAAWIYNVFHRLTGSRFEQCSPVGDTILGSCETSGGGDLAVGSRSLGVGLSNLYWLVFHQLDTERTIGKRVPHLRLHQVGL